MTEQELIENAERIKKIKKAAESSAKKRAEIFTKKRRELEHKLYLKSFGVNENDI